MTYCVGLDLKDGLVMLSDTRTNAGVDHISTFGKMHVVEVPGERVIVLVTAGNLAVSQAVVNLLHEGVEHDGGTDTLLSVPSMFRAAQLVGAAVRRVFEIDGPGMAAQSVPFDVSILIGGQIAARSLRLFQVYAAGNFIEATPDTPFLQIGEHKYGKPILDRAVTYDTPLADGVKLALISMDSTLRSNLTVGMPVDLLVYRRDALAVELRRRITEEDEYFRAIRQRWSDALREAYRTIPLPDWG
ncbi:proteasome-type protease [Arenibaculum sp.]|jgi:putative proteasome-type protease|uniref:proteasome-type protease n=1 Tax=Arenibaculum sp. TaxID=2865862 RepID=UPI002E0F6C36|nr:proteasome-type protease [Arenibaculum sp.]